MWGVYIQELPALNMAEIITPTVSEAERLGEKSGRQMLYLLDHTYSI